MGGPESSAQAESEVCVFAVGYLGDSVLSASLCVP